MEMHLTELIEGHLYSKNDFLDVEDDTDNIDDFISETPYDKLFTHATNETNGSNEEAPSSSSRDRNL